MRRNTLHTNMVGRRVKMLPEHMLTGPAVARAEQEGEVVNVYPVSDGDGVWYDVLFDSDGEIFKTVHFFFRVLPRE